MDHGVAGPRGPTDHDTEVCYFRSDNRYTAVITPDGEALIRVTLRELIDQLDPAVFWQVHRGTVVNANAIAGLVRDDQGRLNIRLKQRGETLLSARAPCLEVSRDVADARKWSEGARPQAYHR